MNGKLTINGQVQEFGENLPATLADLLLTLKIEQATVVAEVNGQIVPRSEFGATALTDGAAIELVRFVGGG